jgi:hypothetical protein
LFIFRALTGILTYFFDGSKLLAFTPVFSAFYIHFFFYGTHDPPRWYAYCWSNKEEKGGSLRGHFIKQRQKGLTTNIDGVKSLCRISS